VTLSTGICCPLQGERVEAKGASGEIHLVKREVQRIIKAVEDGTQETKVGAVIFQGMNVWLNALDTERNIKETEELEERMEALEQALEKRKLPHRA
jgi:hypothetical protein